MPFDAVRYKSFPFLEDGQEPLGSYKNGKWVGLSKWLKRHGQAVICHLSGKPRQAFDVRFGDVRIDIENIGVWRRPDVGERDWTYGTVEISAADVVFTDSPTQPDTLEPPPTSEGSSLESDLFHDPIIRQEIKEKLFADMLFTALAGQDFVRLEDGREGHLPERKAAHFVASLRNRGEYYLDYYPHALGTPPQSRARVRQWLDECLDKLIKGETRLKGPPIEGFVETLARFRKARAIEVDENHPLYRFMSNEKAKWDQTFEVEERDRALPHIRRLGWRPKTNAEYEREFVRDRRAQLGRRVEVLRLMRQFEKLEPRARPDWAERLMLLRTLSANVNGLENLSLDEKEAASSELVSRLCRLAETGRLSRDEFQMMRELLIRR